MQPQNRDRRHPAYSLFWATTSTICVQCQQNSVLSTFSLHQLIHLEPYCFHCSSGRTNITALLTVAAGNISEAFNIRGFDAMWGSVIIFSILCATLPKPVWWVRRNAQLDSPAVLRHFCSLWKIESHITFWQEMMKVSGTLPPMERGNFPSSKKCCNGPMLTSSLWQVKAATDQPYYAVVLCLPVSDAQGLTLHSSHCQCGEWSDHRPVKGARLGKRLFSNTWSGDWNDLLSHMCGGVYMKRNASKKQFKLILATKKNDVH